MLRLQRGVAGVFVAFKSLQIAGQVIGAQFDQVKQAFDLGGELNDLRARTGIAVGDIAVLRQEFSNAGKSAEDVGPANMRMRGTGMAKESVHEPQRARSADGRWL